MSDHYPQDNACHTCHGCWEIDCDRCDGKGCRHCAGTGLIDCPTCQSAKAAAPPHRIGDKDMNTNCPNCDRADCQVPDLSKRIAKAHRETPWLETEAEHLIVDAKLLCQANTVNWRARALTEAARADAAEAELRTLREGLPRWAPENADKDRLRLIKDQKFLGQVVFVRGQWQQWVTGVPHMSDTQEAARRLVERHHGLPPCEVLP